MTNVLGLGWERKEKIEDTQPVFPNGYASENIIPVVYVLLGDS